MNHFRRVRLFGAFALALACAMTWQQTNEAKAQEIPWVAPLAAPLHLISPFRAPSSDYSAGHRGVDYQVRAGQAIFAPTGGSVYFAGTVVDRPLITFKTNTGDLLEFEPACGSYPAGTRINAGDAIGSSCSGNANYKMHCDACLHFSLRTAAGYLSPLARYGALAPSVLLPHF